MVENKKEDLEKLIEKWNNSIVIENKVKNLVREILKKIQLFENISNVEVKYVFTHEKNNKVMLRTVIDIYIVENRETGEEPKQLWIFGTHPKAYRVAIVSRREQEHGNKYRIYLDYLIPRDRDVLKEIENSMKKVEKAIEMFIEDTLVDET